MRLSVVVVNWNSRDDLRACLASLESQSHHDLEIVVVDNGSGDGSAAMVPAEFPGCTLLAESENLGFAEGSNRGIAASTGPWVALLNNDAVADRDWARALVAAAAEVPADCGMLQSLLLFQQKPETINSTGLELTRSGSGRDRDNGRPRSAGDSPRDIFCPTAGAAAYRRAMLDAIRLSDGYLDREHFMYLEDLDLGWRARLAGWTARYVPESFVYHTWKGSALRHGPSWLVVLSNTNRVRTLLKNASPWLIAATSWTTVAEVVELAWHGRLRALGGLARAAGHSLAQRREVTAMARLERRAVERAWVRGAPLRG